MPGGRVAGRQGPVRRPSEGVAAAGRWGGRRRRGRRIFADHAADDYNDLKFALPANPGYLPRKRLAAEARLGPAAAVWSEP